MPATVEDALAGIQARIPGILVWRAWVGVGSFLTLEMGGERVLPRGHVIGADHLWIYGAEWLVAQGGNAVATSSDDRATMEAAAALISSHRVASVALEPESMGIEFEFEGSLRLTVAALRDPDMEEWFWYLPDGDVVTAAAGLDVESASK